jgi:mRNA-degrading endonuclease RelE of RelBE toxin-antitoxin system
MDPANANVLRDVVWFVRLAGSAPVRHYRVQALSELRRPPGNRLKRLRDDRAGQYSIRVNEQYRICFRWEDGYADEVEVTDYH